MGDPFICTQKVVIVFAYFETPPKGTPMSWETYIVFSTSIAGIHRTSSQGLLDCFGVPSGRSNALDAKLDIRDVGAEGALFPLSRNSTASQRSVRGLGLRVHPTP